MENASDIANLLEGGEIVILSEGLTKGIREMILKLLSATLEDLEKKEVNAKSFAFR
jgi:hypothetical protein